MKLLLARCEVERCKEAFNAKVEMCPKTRAVENRGPRCHMADCGFKLAKCQVVSGVLLIFINTNDNF